MLRRQRRSGLIIGLLLPLATIAQVDAADDTGTAIRLAGGALTMKAPKSWKKKDPRFRIIQYEFAIASSDGKTAPARVTIMGAGGSIRANIDRWKSQFAKLSRSGESAFKVGKVAVTLVDLEGTFRERSGGPFSGAPEKLRTDYQMLGAIIVTPDKGQYFIKIIGPKATLAKQDDALKNMLKAMKFGG